LDLEDAGEELQPGVPAGPGRGVGVRVVLGAAIGDKVLATGSMGGEDAVVADEVEVSSEIASRLGVSTDPVPLLEPLVNSLQGKAGDLLRQAQLQGHLMEALDSFNLAFGAKLAEVTLEELPGPAALSGD
jgi:hypothetical protein